MQGLGFAIVGAIQRLTRTGAFAPPRYCESCGKLYVEKTYQDGYDRSTGAPVVKTFRGCPDAGSHPDSYRGNDCLTYAPPPRDPWSYQSPRDLAG